MLIHYFRLYLLKIASLTNTRVFIWLFLILLLNIFNEISLIWITSMIKSINMHISFIDFIFFNIRTDTSYMMLSSWSLLYHWHLSYFRPISILFLSFSSHEKISFIDTKLTMILIILNLIFILLHKVLMIYLFNLISHIWSWSKWPSCLSFA